MTPIVRAFRDKLFTEIFPGRTWVPKTLIFAKSEAEKGEHPVDVRPAERASHGRPALGFRAERDARAKKHAHSVHLAHKCMSTAREGYAGVSIVEEEAAPCA